MNNNINIQKLLSKFTPHSDYKATEFYCVSMMRMKKNSKFSIKLVHDFKNGNSITSSAIEIEDRKMALAIYEVLDDYSDSKRTGSKAITIDDICGDDEPKGAW